MTDPIQQWVYTYGGNPPFRRDPRGPWVLAADAEAHEAAAVAAARAEAKAEATAESIAAVGRAVDHGRERYEQGQRDALATRHLTADDPEPAVGSVVLTPTGVPYLRVNRHGGWQMVGDERIWEFVDALRFGPVTLIHDAAPQDEKEAP